MGVEKLFATIRITHRPLRPIWLDAMLEFEDERIKKIEVEKKVQLSHYFQTLKVLINRLIRDK